MDAALPENPSAHRVRQAKRGALIGCGFYADNHLNAWAELEDVDIVAVCDLDSGKARSAAEKFGALPYTDAEEMLTAQKPDFVDIATTMGSHRVLVELCARHAIPTIVQKPFAPTYSDCLAMVKACGEATIPLMVHENFRFQQPMRRVKEVLDAGTIGTPTFARLSFRTGYDVKSGQPYLFNEERFVVLDLGIHVLDLARFFLGEVESVYSRHQRIDPRVKGEDMATIMLGHTNGATSIVDVTYESRKLPDSFPQTLLVIEGTKGAVDIGHNFAMTVSVDGQPWRVDDPAKAGQMSVSNVSTPLRPWTSEPWHTSQDSVFHTQSHWLQCLRTGCVPETSGDDNLKTYALVEAAYASAASGQAVSMISFVERLQQAS